MLTKNRPWKGKVPWEGSLKSLCKVQWELCRGHGTTAKAVEFKH